MKLLKNHYSEKRDLVLDLEMTKILNFIKC